MANIKIILIILSVFFIAFATSLLLEFAIFKHWLRYTLVLLLIVVEFYIGYLIYNYATVYMIKKK
tara:strand:+ start:2699 stop:2893 length:195 start_codon:yes stop_codon:yes gene_type:complete